MLLSAATAKAGIKFQSSLTKVYSNSMASERSLQESKTNTWLRSCLDAHKHFYFVSQLGIILLCGEQLNKETKQKITK